MEDYRVLITGANAGLGFSTCCRLIDEFLATRQSKQRLHLIITTRDKRKNDETLHRLKQHTSKTIRSVYGSHVETASIRDMQAKRIKLEGELVDLCQLRTVRQLTQRLIDRKLNIHVLILNAGIGGWIGMNWFQAVWDLATNLVNAATQPQFKLGYLGRLVGLQRVSEGSQQKDVASPPEPPLGETFTANLFGHYLLVHWLASLLTSPSSPDGTRSRVIWVSSIEAEAEYFNPLDLQSLTTQRSYESSKRLTDILVLNSETEACRSSFEAFLPLPSDTTTGTRHQPARPKMYVCHPGVVATNISQISPFLVHFMIGAFYLARLLGSPWHGVTPYIGAVSTVWLALASGTTLDGLERRVEGSNPVMTAATTTAAVTGHGEGDTEPWELGGKAKWGSATDRMGNERVARTEVQWYGWGGNAGEVPDGTWKVATLKGRHRPVRDEDLQAFEEQGVRAWADMERLRVQWEKILSDGE